jgi:predicted lipoprotein with Yx(FWY)xxD motif
MFYGKRALLLVGLLLSLFVAACGMPFTSTTSGNSNTMSNTNKDQGTMMTGGTAQANNMTPTSMGTPAAGGMTHPTATAATNMGGGNMQNNTAFIKTTQVKINGKMVVVLTNAKGMILYYKLNDPRPASSCTGMCAQDWPPVLAKGMTMISSSMTLPHKLAVYMTANGNQVEYDGHPLYTYAGDMAPGQFAGRGMDNVWYLVSTTL